MTLVTNIAIIVLSDEASESDNNPKGRKENEMDMTERERKDTMMSTLYEIRLMVDADSKATYTKEEILNLLDTIARAKGAE